MHRFKENIKYDQGLFLNAGTATATEYTGTAVDMSRYNNFVGIISGVMAAATNNVGALVCQIAQSTDCTTWSDTYLPATATAASSTASLSYLGMYGTIVECRAEQLADGYRYIRVEVTPAGGTTNNINIVNLRFNPRFAQETLFTNDFIRWAGLTTPP
jgi:hypothetical protein